MTSEPNPPRTESGPALTGTAALTKPHEIAERALELSRADGTVVIAEERTSANLRWAANALTTNGTTEGRTLTVIALVDGAEGTASGVVSRSAVTAGELEPLVRAAEAAARGSGPAEDARPLITGTAPDPGFTEPPARTSPQVFAELAPALGECFARARDADHLLYGFAVHEMATTYCPPDGTRPCCRRPPWPTC
ncbi:Putative modulator of DNA gyrase [Streptomyces aidingensis]|uniref:Putative modulator of DNA gyrase n=1 Tax=Streptomyces aidingensis TaxID=910347 RepID=A0A1I1M070_9ACTN|nr:Putative modulator of DNA gyrase [Streptomyces aidingensis]